MHQTACDCFRLNKVCWFLLCFTSHQNKSRLNCLAKNCKYNDIEARAMFTCRENVCINDNGKQITNAFLSFDSFSLLGMAERHVIERKNIAATSSMDLFRNCQQWCRMLLNRHGELTKRQFYAFPLTDCELITVRFFIKQFSSKVFEQKMLNE